MSQSTEYLHSTCDQCNRKGFTWARGYCQYCGHLQYEVPENNPLRKAKDRAFIEADQAYNKAREASKVKNLNDPESSVRVDREADERFFQKMKERRQS